MVSRYVPPNSCTIMLKSRNTYKDPITQYPGYISYAASNPYHPLVNSSVIMSANDSLSSCEAQVCLSRQAPCQLLFTHKFQIVSCNNGGSDSVCSAAQGYCNNNILSPLPGNYDVSHHPLCPPDFYTLTLFDPPGLLCSNDEPRSLSSQYYQLHRQYPVNHRCSDGLARKQ